MRNRLRISGGSAYNMKDAFNPSDKRTPPPSWVKYSVAIGKVEQYMRENFRDDNARQLLYYLPPQHLFFGDSLSDNSMNKLHNWLRIKSWCFSQIKERDELRICSAQDSEKTVHREIISSTNRENCVSKLAESIAIFVSPLTELSHSRGIPRHAI